MAALELENRLVLQLIGSGATPAEARRLASLAHRISTTRLYIDPAFSQNLERVLVGTRPAETQAEIIWITRKLDAPTYREPTRLRLVTLPTAQMRTPSRLRFALCAAALGVLTFAFTWLLSIYGVASGPPGPGPRQDRHLDNSQALPAPERGARPIADAGATSPKRSPAKQTNGSPDPSPQPQSRGCSFGGNKERGGGVVPVPEVSCDFGVTRASDEPSTPKPPVTSSLTGAHARRPPTVG